MKRVFISSTSQDLGDYRQAAIDTCMKLDLHPIAMEHFPAMSVGATAGSKLKLAETELYIGIYAHRYGYIEDGNDHSVTEIEFDYAGECGIDRLCFLVDPTFPWPPDSIDHANYPKLEVFKAKVNKLIRAQFTTVDDFRAKLFQALLAWQNQILVNPNNCHLTLKLDITRPEFDENKFISIIAKLAQVGFTDIQIVSIQDGSIILTLEMPKEAGLRLAKLLQNPSSELEIYRIKDIQIASSTQNVLSSVNSVTSAVHITHADDVLERAPKLFGRDDLLAQIAAGLTGNDPLLLQGFSGMGKTALAAQAVYDWLKAGKGNTLWLKAGSASAEEIFQALARPFGASQVLAAQTGDALLQTVRAMLRETGIKLLVLDDCWNAKALATVLKAVPSDLPVLLTARREYGIRQTLKVDALASDEAIKLLGYHANQNFTDDPAARELCKQLGYLPFALRIAGINLQKQYHLKPAELSLKIKNTAHELTVPLDFAEDGRENVASLLKISLDALDAEARAVFITCGAFFATTITPEMMAFYQNGVSESPKPDLENLLKGDKPDPEQLIQALTLLLKPSVPLKPDSSAAESALTTLAHHGLIERIPATEKAIPHYRLHDLAYSYARAANDDAAHHRALDVCLTYLANYNQPSLANFAALRPELPNLLAAADWALAIGRYAVAQSFAWDLYPEGSQILDYDGFYSQAIHLCLRAAEAAVRQNNPRNQGAHLGNLGSAYFGLGQYDRAIGYHEQALVISREIGDRHSESSILGNLGIAYRNVGQYDRAIGYHEQALVISREIGDRRGEGSDLGNLGNAYHNLGEYERAIGYHEQALTISREIGDRRGEGSDLGNLGNAYHNLGEYERAIGYHEQALSIRREIGDRRGEGRDLGNLGNAYHNLEQYERAIDYYEQALAISREIGDRLGEANRLNNIGSFYDDQGDYPQAITYFEQARAIFATIGTLHLVKDVDRNLARIRAKVSGDS